jgi:hypothetical protein
LEQHEDPDNPDAKPDGIVLKSSSLETRYNEKDLACRR